MAAPVFPFDLIDPSGGADVVNLDDYRFRPRIGPEARNSSRVRPLTLDEVENAIASEIRDSLGHESSQLAEDRRHALRSYYGKPFGNEEEGRSNFVMTDTADTIEWIMPSLIRMFVGSGIIWRFKPRKPGQEKAAECATRVINHMFLNEMGGFMVLYDWFKTALIEKNGYVHPRWEETYEPKRLSYFGVTQSQVGLVMQNPNCEIIELNVHEGENLYDLNSGTPIVTYDVTTMQTVTTGRILCDGIPPEEFLISRREIKLYDETQYAAHRRKLTISKLVTMGHDPALLVDLPSDDKPEYDLARTERFSLDETWPTYTNDRVDPASRDIWVTDSYIRIDEDGDGYAELRNILSVGDGSVTILSDEWANFMPFCSLCPVPMPHKFHGISYADLTNDLQVVRSTLIREMIDSAFLANTPRWLVDDSADVDVDALLNTVPGGVVLTSNTEGVAPLVTQPVPQQAFQLMEYLEGVIEKRTGATKWMMGPDASALKDSTLGGVTEAMKASGQKVEMIARIFAETGVKQLGQNLYRLMVENASHPHTMRIEGEWVDVDPSSWGETMDLDVEVGLGIGQAAALLANLSMVADRQKQMLENPASAMMVSPKNVYNLAQTATEALGMRLEDQYFTNPGDAPWPQAAPPLSDQVRKMESERRSKDDAQKAQISAMQLAIDSSEQDQLQIYRAAQMDHEERMKRAELVTREQITAAQVQGQIDAAAMANRGE